MDEVIEFIIRRFKTDCSWITGNCYYFAVILQSRFPGGDILYDVSCGHFVYSYCGKFYDWSGELTDFGNLVKWSDFENYDHLQKERIISGCIM